MSQRSKLRAVVLIVPFVGALLSLYYVNRLENCKNTNTGIGAMISYESKNCTMMKYGEAFYATTWPLTTAAVKSF